MNNIHLIPYRVEKVVETPPRVPEGVQMIQAPELWARGEEGEGNVIAVLDTGCENDHPNLQGRIVGGRNFTHDDNGDPEKFYDYNGHGTHVAGTIAAFQSEETGILGVAPSANLLIVKVLNKEGSGSYEGIIAGIHYAVDWQGPEGEKVTVISMSLGGPENHPELYKAVKRAVDSGIPVVCAAGNEGDDIHDTDEFAYPGAYGEVIQVGAADFDRRIAPFSNTNNEIDLVAPGINIYSTYLEGKYASLSGTSMATPHVSGALALIRNTAERDFARKLTESELYAQLVRHTIPIGYPKTAEGNGLLALDILNKFEQLFKLLSNSYDTSAKPK